MDLSAVSPLLKSIWVLLSLNWDDARGQKSVVAHYHKQQCCQSDRRSPYAIVPPSGSSLGSGGAVVNDPNLVVKIDRHKYQISGMVIDNTIGMHPVAIVQITVVIDVNFSWVLSYVSIGAYILIYILYELINTVPLPYNFVGVWVNFDKFLKVNWPLCLGSKALACWVGIFPKQ